MINDDCVVKVGCFKGGDVHVAASPTVPVEHDGRSS